MQNKNGCSKVASYIQTNCDDLPHIKSSFGNTLVQMLDGLYQSALYGFLLAMPNSEDYAKVTLLHYDTLAGFEETIMYGASEVGTITWLNASIDGLSPAVLSYKPFIPTPENE